LRKRITNSLVNYVPQIMWINNLVELEKITPN
jgi:hypothetical protein